MKKKLFWFPFLAALFSMIFLYGIGYMFEISYLGWFLNSNPNDGSIFAVAFSLNPVIIGFIVGFITERIMKKKHKNLA